MVPAGGWPRNTRSPGDLHPNRPPRALSLMIPGLPPTTSPLGTSAHSVFVAEIMGKVVSPPPLCRPRVSADHGPPECIQLMEQCWEEAPEYRPTLDQVYTQVSAPRGAGCLRETADQFTSLARWGPHAVPGPGNSVQKGGSGLASSPLKVGPEVYPRRKAFAELGARGHLSGAFLGATPCAGCWAYFI